MKSFESCFPPGVLEKLQPFAQDIGEILGGSIDFPHQKYHVLDNLLHFRYFDQECYKMQRFMDHLDEEERRKFTGPDWWNIDLITYDLIERAIRFHDNGRYFVEKGVLKPNEHHFGSLFVAMNVDGDPRVCEAVFHHVDDVLPADASTVERYVRDIDRIVGAGYVGLIRVAMYYGFKHPLLEETDEDKVVFGGVLMAIPDRFGKIDESKAKNFFWQSVYPHFESQGPDGLRLLGTLSKIMLDRIVGRDYTSRVSRKLTPAEKDVLLLDNNSLVVEGVTERLVNMFSYKVKDTLEVLVRTRGAMSLNKEHGGGFLSRDEEDSYLWPVPL